MPNRSRYWSCTAFADWLRGTPKPGSATAEDWSAWRKMAKKSHKFRFWLAEEALDSIQNFIWWPVDRIYAVKYYINNRWISRSHALTSSPDQLPRGEWCDVGNRFLPCLFNELKDYVEIELAWWHIAWDDEAAKKFTAPFWARGWFRWRTWRCPAAGLENLEWQRGLRWTAEEVGENSDVLDQPTPQAVKAEEILALYKWWTEVYPNRPDVHDASGWTAFCDHLRKKTKDNDDDEIAFLSTANRTPEEEAESRRALDLCRKIEEQYEQEDEAMLIRLIKIRHSLWT